MHGHGVLEDAAESVRDDRAFLAGLASDDHREHLRWVSPALQADRAFVVDALRLGTASELGSTTARRG